MLILQSINHTCDGWFLQRNVHQACRQRFTHNKIVGHLRALDAGLAERYSTMCRTAIDRGAHPNVEGVKLTETESPISDTRTNIEIAILTGDQDLIRETLKNAIDAGMIVRDVVMRSLQEL